MPTNCVAFSTNTLLLSCKAFSWHKVGVKTHYVFLPFFYAYRQPQPHKF